MACQHLKTVLGACHRAQRHHPSITDQQVQPGQAGGEVICQRLDASQIGQVQLLTVCLSCTHKTHYQVVAAQRAIK